MQTALLQLLEGVGWWGTFPRTFPLRGRGGWRSPLPGRISKQKWARTGLFTGNKVTTRALEIAFSYALEKQMIHLSEKKPALTLMCEKLSEAQNEPGKQRQICLGLWACTPLQWHQGCSCCYLHLQNNSSFQKDFKLQHCQVLIPSKCNPWTAQSRFNHNNLLYTSCTSVTLHCIFFALSMLRLDLSTFHMGYFNPLPPEDKPAFSL